MNGETRTCQNCKNSFPIEPEDFEFYEKIQVPPPNFCSNCRYQRRLANRNEWSFYQRACSLCGRMGISIYSPDYPGPVYCSPCFWSDRWDARSYAQDFDFSRSFFEQFKEFRFKVPRLAITNTESVNSEYTNQAQQNKNCYLIVASNRNEDCMYGNWYQSSKDCTDCYAVEKCELLYESLNCTQCYHGAYLQNCYDCNSSYFLKDCRGCDSCFGCVGLRNKKYRYLNEQLTEDEYRNRLRGFQWTQQNIAMMQVELQNLSLSVPVKFYEGRNNTFSTGDYIEHTKHALHTFNARHCEDVKYVQDAWWSRDSFDLTEVFSEYSYEIEGSITARCIATSRCWQNMDASYSELCFHCNDIFACVSMMKKNFYIFNKQYSKEEYQTMKNKIIHHMRETGEWGEFFPITTSPFAYNETVAQEYFPLTRAEVEEKGWRWHERDVRDYRPTKKAAELLEYITAVDDNILKEIILCKTRLDGEDMKKYLNCATAFRITKDELNFYRKIGLPLPTKCFHCRRQDRLSLRNPRMLWHRPCTCGGEKSKNGIYSNQTTHFHGLNHCPNEFETSYPPERPEIVYCEQCYNSEVV